MSPSAEAAGVPAGGANDGTGAPECPPDDRAGRSIPRDTLIIVPLRGMVLFPGVVLPVTIGRKRSLEAVQEAVRSQRPLGLILQRNLEVQDPGPADLHRVGTTASLLRYLPGDEGAHVAICQGRQRFVVGEFLEGHPFLLARHQLVEEVEEISLEIEARFHVLKEQAREVLGFLPQAPSNLIEAVENIESPSALADMVATFLDIKVEEKQEILETFGIRERLDRTSALVARRLQVLRLSREISSQARGSLEKAQREVLLREQLKAIQKELGEDGSAGQEVEELERAIAAAKMPPEVEKQVRKELSRLRAMPEAAAEHSMIRTYLQWMVDLPWSVLTSDSIDIRRARETLDQDHFGLEKVKRRILEYLAVRKLKPEGKSPILCFVGPPGVGKTSLGQSIARAMGRKFVRLSLGGIHDEAEVRGHRRTYVGALPGNIIQGIRRAGTRNPVFMLDELDKLGAGFHGDPSSALLEVLDPEQNTSFQDHYLGVDFDLSKVMFIGTANVLEAIPRALRDRLEVIEIGGYTEDEKVEIARRFLIPRQREASGLTPEQCEVLEDGLREVTRHYTREAGCRNLEREIASLFRHLAMRIADGSTSKARIGKEQVRTILGLPRFEAEVAMRTGVPGVATGLAWTPVGGDILFIEATWMPGSGKLILTGQLGEVMKESAQAALSLVKSRAGELGLDPQVFERKDIHIHVPEGAMPKDGPSAGVAIYIALVSLFTGRVVRSDTAMTGEISLRGLVLPVGGIKEKVLGALRAGISSILLPERNRKDLEDVPQKSRTRLRFVFLERVEEAAAEAIASPVKAARPEPASMVDGG